MSPQGSQSQMRRICRKHLQGSLTGLKWTILFKINNQVKSKGIMSNITHLTFMETKIQINNSRILLVDRVMIFIVIRMANKEMKISTCSSHQWIHTRWLKTMFQEINKDFIKLNRKTKNYWNNLNIFKLKMMKIL